MRRALFVVLFAIGSASPLSAAPPGPADTSQAGMVHCVQCRHCGAKFDLAKLQPPPERCPICGHREKIYEDASMEVWDWSRACPKLTAKPPCKEAGFFYDDKTLASFYTGEPSLNVNGEQLVTGIIGAIQKFEQEGGRATAGVQNLDAPFLAQAFDSSALPTGREQALRDEASALAERQGKLGPADLFYCALKATGGNVRDALVACHAALYRDKGKANAAFIEKSLQPLRNPNGYQKDATVTRWNDQLKREEKVSPRDSCGNDQQGAWYHLFGMAALEFTDRHGLTPFYVVRKGAEMAKPAETAPLAQNGFPMSEVCGKLSNYAVALENQVRSNMRRAPDPDKQCVNYFGAAIGTALAKYLQLPAQRGMLAKLMGVETRRQLRTNMDYAWLMKSPLSLRLRGTGGEELTFDQQAKLFGGNTDLVYVDPLVEQDGTWGLVVVPFFEVRDVQWTAVGTGPATIAVHDLKRGRTRGYGLTVRPGDSFTGTIVQGVPELQRADGSRLVPEVDQATADVGTRDVSSGNGQAAPPLPTTGPPSGTRALPGTGGPVSGPAGSGFPLPLLVVAGVAAVGLGLVILLVAIVGLVKGLGRGPAARVPESGPDPPDIRTVAHLDCRRPDGAWQRVALTDERLTIGRDPSNALVLPEPEASRHHAEIGRTPDGVFVRDLGSRAGTWVNGARVDETWLSPGDSIQIAGTLLVVPGAPDRR